MRGAFCRTVMVALILGGAIPLAWYLNVYPPKRPTASVHSGSAIGPDEGPRVNGQEWPYVLRWQISLYERGFPWPSRYEHQAFVDVIDWNTRRVLKDPAKKNEIFALWKAWAESTNREDRPPTLTDRWHVKGIVANSLFALVISLSVFMVPWLAWRRYRRSRDLGHERARNVCQE